MGDRSWGMISIHGTIETVAVLEPLLDAIEEQNCETLMADQADRRTILEEMLDAIKEKCPLKLADAELSGGELQIIDTACRELQLPFVAQWDACGGAYDAGIRSWHPTMGEAEASYDDNTGALISLNALVEAHAKGTVQALIDKGKQANGDPFPPFAISAEVRAFIEQELGTNG